MTLPIDSIGDNSQMPGIFAETYIPDQLIAGNLKLISNSVTNASGQLLRRGTVMGLVTTTGFYTVATSAATDGSQNPCAILADTSDATAGNVTAGVYLMGEFNANSLILGAGMTLPTVTSALRLLAMFVKNVITASDPS